MCVAHASDCDLLPCSLSDQELNLSFGEITEEAALALAHAVKSKTHLEKLDLNGRDPPSLPPTRAL